jgi:lysophosphatidate acyltransferase
MLFQFIAAIMMKLIRPLAYLSLPIFLLNYIAKRHALTRYYWRLSIYLSAMSACSLLGIVVALPLTLVGRRFDINYVVARSFQKLSSKLLGFEWEVEGEENLLKQSAVYLATHQSMLDLMFLGRVFPTRCSIMAKKELRWAPLLGQFMWLGGAVFVDRGNRNNKDAIKSLAAAGNIMKKRDASLWIFPEGTRTLRPENDLLPFKKGAFHLAVQSGVPIVPIVCENYWRYYHKGVLEAGKLKIRVLKPIPTDTLTTADVAELAIRTREAMVTALREISVPYPPKEKDAPTASSSPIDIIESRPAGQKNISLEKLQQQQTPSSASPTETDEDEGLVLVGRP